MEYDKTFTSEDLREGYNLIDLEKDLIDHYKISNSFFGWLLTLSDEDFEFVKQRMDPRNLNNTSLETFTVIPIIHFLKGKLGDFVISEKEANDSYSDTLTKIIIISLVRSKQITYKVADTDDEWKFSKLKDF